MKDPTEPHGPQGSSTKPHGLHASSTETRILHTSPQSHIYTLCKSTEPHIPIQVHRVTYTHASPESHIPHASPTEPHIPIQVPQSHIYPMQVLQSPVDPREVLQSHMDLRQVPTEPRGPQASSTEPHGLGIEAHKPGVKSSLQYQLPRDPEASCSPSLNHGILLSALGPPMCTVTHGKHQRTLS